MKSTPLKPTGRPTLGRPVCGLAQPLRSSLANSSRKHAKLSLTPSAVVDIQTSTGQWLRVRALLDTGSETNAISSLCVRRCNLALMPDPTQIVGVGGKTVGLSPGWVQARVKQQFPHPQLIVNFRVLDRIADFIPSLPCSPGPWEHLKNCSLSDPTFFSPGPVEVIFSAGMVDRILTGRYIPSQNGSPNARESTFGWVLSGEICPPPKCVRFHPSVKDNTQSSKDSPRAHHSRSRSESSSPVVLASSVPEPKPQRVPWCRRPLRRSTGLDAAPERQSTQQDAHNSTAVYVSTPNQVNFPKTAPSSGVPFPKKVTRRRPRKRKLRTIVTSETPPDEPEVCQLLHKLFALEAVTPVSPLSPDEIKAEEQFAETVVRDTHGRFVVRLPFQRSAAPLGSSKRIALQRLYHLEHQLKRKPHLRSAYKEFMKEYLDEGHMELAPPLSPNQPHYYIPHHAVHRPDDPPEKIRVVFNASQKTDSGVSLNELLLPGPRLQLDLWKVVLRFRFDRWVFAADIRQMFRQISHPVEDRDFLRICWRFSPDEPIRDYRLTTVTYGTTSAPFLACRVLQELAGRYTSSHSAAAEVLRTRTYVDDVNGGGPTIPHALANRDQLIDLLQRAQLELRKWSANDARLLQGIPSEHTVPAMTSIPLESEEDEMKILGVYWNPGEDAFHFQIRPTMEIRTKRELASQIARIFDPLGWLMPITVFARIIFRSVCQASHEWDSPLPPTISREWTEFASQLPALSAVKIPRHMAPFSERYLVGFADASERAYAAVVYLVTRNGEQSSRHLIMSKARIAPMKVITLPRLELCAAHLLSRLLQLIHPLFEDLPSQNLFAFSDSTVTLAWITATSPPVWKTFVGNRVASILEHVPAQRWYHVASKDNPADHASRGLKPNDLQAPHQWWNGPSWLVMPFDNWPLTRAKPDFTDPTIKSEARTFPACHALSLTGNKLMDQIENRFSSLLKLQDTVAWCLRFSHNVRYPRAKRTGSLSCAERKHALVVLIHRAQTHSLSLELADAQSAKPRLPLSRTLGLFVDTDGILRVGGRLLHADIPDHSKHPALLPASHPLTTLIIHQAHVANLHVGPSSTHAYLRNLYWIVNGKNVIRRQLAKCNHCFSVSPQPFTPPMGQLPLDRTKPSPPFHVVGVDYAGPFTVKMATFKALRAVSIYLAIFVCFSTKAVHIEVVSDLSTPTFIAAYRRFVARRGHPITIWSDNGRNFVGARKELKSLAALLRDSAHNAALAQETANHSTTWNFIPPHAPHFGGLWEAAVKSAKRLLKVTLGSQVPTLECFYTIVTQIEAILNSRPLTLESASPDDPQALTPGHFLIQRPLTAPPTNYVINAHTAQKSKWTMTQFIVAQFWKRWTKEYLLQQQALAKWNTPAKPATVGQVVILMEDNLPPLQWSLGRIVALFPGKDTVSRVATVQTATGQFKRPLRKLCPLPTQ